MQITFETDDIDIVSLIAIAFDMLTARRRRDKKKYLYSITTQEGWEWLIDELSDAVYDLAEDSQTDLTRIPNAIYQELLEIKKSVAEMFESAGTEAPDVGSDYVQ